jgi:hypothetical protein
MVLGRASRIAAHARLSSSAFGKREPGRGPLLPGREYTGPMDGSSAATLVFAGPLVRAQQVWSALRAHAFEASLLNQHVGNLYQPGDVHVVVPASELARARALLLELGLVTGPRDDPRPS